MRFGSILLAVLSVSCTASLPPTPPPKPDLAAGHAALVSDALVPICSSAVVGEKIALTAQHCISPGLSINGKLVIQVIYPDPDVDVAVLITEEPIGLPPAVLGKGHKGKLRIFGFGCSKMQRVESRELVYFFDSLVGGVICPGDSGSGVYNDADELVGIAVAKFVSKDGSRGGVVIWLD